MPLVDQSKPLEDLHSAISAVLEDPGLTTTDSAAIVQLRALLDRYKSMDDATLAVLTSPTISVNQYAALMGVDRTTAYAAVKNGEVDAIRVGSKRIRIPSAPLRRLLGLDEAATGA